MTKQYRYVKGKKIHIGNGNKERFFLDESDLEESDENMQSFLE